MNADDIARYSRQLILPDIGYEGQQQLQNSKVLIIGAGGLGCPVAIYLAAGGVGHIGIVDDDEVDISNLHRQVLHTEARKGLPKAHSIVESLRSVNSKCVCKPYVTRLNPTNALDIVGEYDVVVDASDNAPTRYLINDVCLAMNKPLVSGSAVRTEGQLTVYNYKGGPCYRCLFPTPPPAATVTNCSDGGVLGVVPGIIGTMQASETIKVLLKKDGTLHGRLFIFEAMRFTTRTIKLRPRREDCICQKTGTEPPSFFILRDYEEFCHMEACDAARSLDLIDSYSRMDARLFASQLWEQGPCESNVDVDDIQVQTLAAEESSDDETKCDYDRLVIDVRAPVEFNICRFTHSYNFPLPVLRRCLLEPKRASLQELQTLHKLLSKVSQSSINNNLSGLCFVCRRGNDSQVAVQQVIKFLQDEQAVNTQDIEEEKLQLWMDLVSLLSSMTVVDMRGGFTALAKCIPNFPIY